MGQQLVLKSKNVLTDLTGLPDYAAYKNRVEADGGIIVDEQSTLNAFLFIYQNNINEGDVFTAVNPAWGIKTSGTSVVRLYSLFGEQGDMVSGVGGTSPTLSSVNGVPAVYLGGSNKTYLKSSGRFSSGVAASFAAIRIPVLASYGPGMTTTVPVSMLVNPNLTPGETAIKTLSISALARPSTANNNPLEWSFKSFGGAAILGDPTTTPYQHGSNVGTISDGSKLSLMIDGSVIASAADVTTTDPLRNTDVQAFLGKTFTANGSDSPTYFLGNIAEYWVLINNVSASSAISSRLNSLYKAALA